ncbi:hypothetical protein Tsubulata_845010 [Turnera subulata]|uniref:Pectinesterase n=1 Tax=Turnera subulata TaxID=218843 RepID=A0A9Q0G1D6_9ROSI|nr:hypothetical protein Tsubulata_845010 [Turnera subulata]
MGNDNERKKKVATVVASSFIAICMVVAVTVGISNDIKKQAHEKDHHLAEDQPGGEDHSISTSNKAIVSICHPADYKDTCLQTLTKAAGNTTDPIQLAKFALMAAIKSLRGAKKDSAALDQLAKDPLSSQAIESCRELLHTAIADLRDSFAYIDSLEVNQHLSSLNVWLSAATTYLQTCQDGFQNTTDQVGAKMKALLVTPTHLTRNGLAIVIGLESSIKDFNNGTKNHVADVETKNLPHRGLLESQGDFPSWVDAGKRKLLEETLETIKPDIIVAQDGSGHYKTINDAVRKIPKKGNATFVIYIKEGVYKENVILGRSMTHVMMIGDDAEKTRITGNLSFSAGVQTFKTATVAISGNHFMAKDIGFENSAGAVGHQAVALKVQSDKSVFYRCRMDGYQDTLYAHTYRQFYRDCTITGTVDFIFGNAAAVFQNCNLVVRKPLEKQECIVTAQGRGETHEVTGFVIQNCTITADEEYYPLRLNNPAFLGRPWRIYSRTIVMESQIDDLISPQGWFPWAGNFGLDTSFYSEYNNKGPGATQTKRVTWKGIKNLTRHEIDGFTAAKFIQGDEWITSTGVPYTSGLTNVEEEHSSSKA